MAAGWGFKIQKATDLYVNHMRLFWVLEILFHLKNRIQSRRMVRGVFYPPQIKTEVTQEVIVLLSEIELELFRKLSSRQKYKLNYTTDHDRQMLLGLRVHRLRVEIFDYWMPVREWVHPDLSQPKYERIVSVVKEIEALLKHRTPTVLDDILAFQKQSRQTSS